MCQIPYGCEGKIPYVRKGNRMCAKVSECVCAARPWRRWTALIARLATGGVMTMMMHEAWRDEGVAFG